MHATAAAGHRARWSPPRGPPCPPNTRGSKRRRRLGRRAEPRPTRRSRAVAIRRANGAAPLHGRAPRRSSPSARLWLPAWKPCPRRASRWRAPPGGGGRTLSAAWCTPCSSCTRIQARRSGARSPRRRRCAEHARARRTNARRKTRRPPHPHRPARGRKRRSRSRTTRRSARAPRRAGPDWCAACTSAAGAWPSADRPRARSQRQSRPCASRACAVGSGSRSMPSRRRRWPRRAPHAAARGGGAGARPCRPRGGTLCVRRRECRGGAGCARPATMAAAAMRRPPSCAAPWRGAQSERGWLPISQPRREAAASAGCASPSRTRPSGCSQTSTRCTRRMARGGARRRRPGSTRRRATTPGATRGRGAGSRPCG
mmetsp:Transcript_13006/g.43231  ORF Transcript_13006/g.43231 Transcript_13006/m.43231 type:complete len:371 (-) Transcript_13006:842-1954(-)